jgi:hypothetical protein
MTSSTSLSEAMPKSHSQAKRRAPWLALLLVGCAVLAWLLGAAYTWFLDPEMKFWTAAARQKLEWVEKMRAEHGYVIGVVGGSTTTFGIDAEYIEREYGLPIANLGLHFGMGPACVGFGLSALQRGDVLVLSLEPAMLVADKPSTTPLGSKLSLLMGRPEMNGWLEGNSIISAIQSLGSLQPGGYHVATMIGKLALGQPLYRYTIDKMQPGGLQTTDERQFIAGGMDFSPKEERLKLSPGGAALLKQTTAEAAKRGIKVVYLLPWSYCAPELAEQRRKASEILLDDISKVVTVLSEPSLGVHDRIEDFSDSGQHLTAEAARLRSRFLAEALMGLKDLGDKSENRSQSQTISTTGKPQTNTPR